MTMRAAEALSSAPSADLRGRPGGRRVRLKACRSLGKLPKKVTGVQLLRVEDGKIAEARTYFDQLDRPRRGAGCRYRLSRLVSVVGT